MTLDEMIQETATYIDETLNKSNGQYTDVKTFNKIKSGLNYAYKKICREKYLLEYTETITPDTPLNYQFYRLVSLKVPGTDIDIPYSFEEDSISYDYDGEVDITYNYIPEDLKNLTDVPLLPDTAVDHKILCFYAAFQYLLTEQDSNAAGWLNMWNDGFESIRQPKTKQKEVKSVNGGW